MKNDRVILISWPCTDTDTIEIDWPRVHRTIGTDHTQWLLQQSAAACQLMLENTHNRCSLVAEFYDTRTWQQYHLMWAK